MGFWASKLSRITPGYQFQMLGAFEDDPIDLCAKLHSPVSKTLMGSDSGGRKRKHSPERIERSGARQGRVSVTVPLRPK